MFRNKQKNSIEQKGKYTTLARKIVMALTVMIFVFGIGMAIYKKIVNKTTKVSQTESTVSETPAWWLQKYFGKSVCEEDKCKSDSDPDQDKLTNNQEYFYKTDPLNDHTVGDELSDGQLVAAGFDPSRKGKMSFEEVANDENLLGESLVFADSINKLVAESNDIGSVELPLVNDDQLQIVYSEELEVYKTYSSKLQSTINRYFLKQNNVGEILKSGDDGEVEEVSLKARALASELKTIPVPIKFLMFHKYNIAMFQLLSEIVPVPMNVSDEWFDNARAFLAASQRLDIEKDRLNLNK